ncbi:uncharacterized protein LOC111342903, partial [Stylophora pistillata]|uniref:uncharacterized protein LOC111342903 n=1 Tax=Stylophora pistillata TaxID=50429 RepID=UPI000C050D06
MKTTVSLALFGFVLAVGFSVATTENALTKMADASEAEKPRGEEYLIENDGELVAEDLEDDDEAIPRRGYDMRANNGEFDEEDLQDADMAILTSENDVATENKEFDDGAFDSDDDGGEMSDEDEVVPIEKSADPSPYRRQYKPYKPYKP